MWKKAEKPKSVSSKPKGIKKKKPTGPFSLRSAFIVSLVLTAFLWWLPLFGQMIAGYVGGRKSGSPVKGAAVAAGAVAIFVLVAYLMSMLGFSLMEIQTSITGTLFAGFPALNEFAISTTSYMESFFTTFGTFGSALIVICATTIVFGTIGGIVAGQVRLESEYRSPSSSMMSAVNSSARSVESYKQGKSVGFGSFDDYLPVHAMQVNKLDGASSGKPLVRKASARDVPEPIAEEVKESPLSSVLSMSDRNVQPRGEKTVVASSKDDFEYI